MTNLRKGPKLIILNDCYGCQYCAFNEKNWICAKLDYKILSTQTIAYETDHGNGIGTGISTESPMPDKNCPYLETNEKEFYELKLKEFKDKEIESTIEIIQSIFNMCYYENDNYDFTVIQDGSISIKEIKQITEKLPNYSFIICGQDSNAIKIKLIKAREL